VLAALTAGGERYALVALGMIVTGLGARSAWDGVARIG
jgi:hypothetical protein